MNQLLKSVLVTTLLLVTGAQATAGVDLFEQVRSNDLDALRTAIAQKANPDTRGPREVTPLMHAAAFGSLQSMKILLDAGADVNAKDGFGVTALVWAAGDPAKAKLLVERGADVNVQTTQGRTPLIVAAAHDGNVATVRMLLDKGADINAADFQGDTALTVAAGANDLDIVKLLLERGADPKATSKGGVWSTALHGAASNGNVAMMRLLLAKGADVNAANISGGEVKFGEIALKGLTPLMLAAPRVGVAGMRVLLDAGADVNARDSRGMTPLMFAVSGETQDADVVKLLLARGAEVNVRSNVSETALDWANKFNNPQVIALLKNAGAEAAVQPADLDARNSALVSVRQAMERSVPLLQKTSAEFFRQSGCVGCHHQPATTMATVAARTAGIAIDETAAAEAVKQIVAGWDHFQPFLLQRLDGPAIPDIQISSALALAAARQPSNLVTDTLAVNVAAAQRRDGSWQLTGFSRAPMEESHFMRTAMSLRTLQFYGLPARKAEFDARIAKARKWLEKTKPQFTEDYVWRLVGLYWAGADSSKVLQAAEALRKQQGADGGWAANARLDSDVYSTATALWALHTAGAMSADDEPYRRGVDYLLSRQYDDGSWYVASRSPKFQPYFESGFPFGHDQWVSSAATAWATAALAPAVSVTTSQDSRRTKPLRLARRNK